MPLIGIAPNLTMIELFTANRDRISVLPWRQFVTRTEGNSGSVDNVTRLATHWICHLGSTKGSRTSVSVWAFSVTSTYVALEPGMVVAILGWQY